MSHDIHHVTQTRACLLCLMSDVKILDLKENWYRKMITRHQPVAFVSHLPACVT